MRPPVIAWSLALLGVGIVATMTLLDIANGQRHSPPIMGAVVGIAFLGVGALVASRRPRNPIGWVYVVGMILVEIGGFNNFADQYALYAVVTRPGSLPAAQWIEWFGGPALTLGFFGVLVLPLLLFPDGRLPSTRWRPVAIAAGVAITGQAVLTALGPVRSPVELSNPLGVNPLAGAATVGGGLDLLLIAAILGCAAAPVIRFRRAAGPEREQLKWFAYGVAWIPAVALVDTALAQAAPSVMDAVGPNFWPLSVIGLPIATVVAILRYRLYDIDVLINRSLVYGALSALLAATYFLAVLAFETVLRPLTAGSEVAVALSTLAVVALFTPLRRGIQRFVDRRFYRSRYDAARTLDAFGERLRDEVDLDAVRASLLGAVELTVHPAQASVWLRIE